MNVAPLSASALSLAIAPALLRAAPPFVTVNWLATAPEGALSTVMVALFALVVLVAWSCSSSPVRMVSWLLLVSGTSSKLMAVPSAWDWMVPLFGRIGGGVGLPLTVMLA